jgi:DNA polymerase III delta prime subunit
MMTMTRSTLATFLVVLALPASAQTIYRCTDANGGMLISNTRVDKSCKPVVITQDATIPAPKKPAGAAANPTPAGFPKVQEDAQKARDTDRKRILEQELAGEQRSLDQAQRELTEQQAIRPAESASTTLDRVQPYRDRVAQHERNIVAIQKELSGLR